MVIAVAVGGLLWLPDAAQRPWLPEQYPPFRGGLDAVQADAQRQQQSAGNRSASEYAAPVDQLFPPPGEKVSHVEITHGPELELARAHLAIITWTTNNPGGTDQHFAVVYYGTNPHALDRAAQSPIRLNRGHPETIFRVRVTGLSAYTTYYYSVTSMGSDGASDGVQSAIRQFTTPGPGE